MAITYEAISSVTVGTAVGSFDFTSIPSTYTDLVLVLNGTSNAGAALRFNSDSASNYNRSIMYGNGSSALGTRGNGESWAYQTPPAVSGGDRLTIVYNINNYASNSVFKTVLYRSSYPAGGVSLGVNIWKSTSAITTISCFSNDGGGGTWSVGTTASLYGIKAA